MPHYTIVQHSAYGYKGDPAFSKGLETRSVNTDERNRVVKAGGLLFPTYSSAENYADREMYVQVYGGIIPDAPGTFSHMKIDGLAIYIPKADK